MPLSRLAEMRDPEPVVRVSTRATLPPAPSASNGMPQILDGERVRQAGKGRELNYARVHAYRAGENDGKAKRADLAQENGRERIAGHSP